MYCTSEQTANIVAILSNLVKMSMLDIIND